MSAKTAFVACTCRSKPQKILIFIDCLYNSSKEHQKSQVVVRIVSGVKQINTGIGGNRPIVMLTAAVYTMERFFVEKTSKTVSLCNLLHHFHSELVVVGSRICILKKRSQLMLCGSTLVVLSLCIDTQLPKLLIKVSHKSGNSGLNGTEVVVAHLLTLGSTCTKQSSSRKHKVFSFFKKFFINKEILLFRTNGRNSTNNVIHTKKPGYTQSLLIQRLH